LLVITRLQKFRDAEVHIYTIPANAIAQSVCVTRQAALVRLIVIAKQYIDRCVHIPGYEHITCRVEVLASKLSGDPLHCLKKGFTLSLAILCDKAFYPVRLVQKDFIDRRG